MKKVLILLMFVSLGLVGQTPKMEIVVGTTENVDGIKVTSKNTSPNAHNYSIYGLNKSTNSNGTGVYGGHEGSGIGVHGYSKSGTGVFGFSQMGTFGTGVYGLAYGAGKSGVKGYSENGYGNGILGEAESGIGVKGYALNFFSTTGIGGHFSNASPTGYALITGTGLVGIGTETPAAKMDIKGTSYLSHFYYDTAEDTYIRGGKAGSKVLINDISGMGSVGIGLSNPNELLDVNGRMRIRHNVNTSGIWMSNSTNSLNGADGAFYGMITDTQAGIYIGNAWRFVVNSNGNVVNTGFTQLGNTVPAGAAAGATAPTIKVLKLIGTTASTQGTSVSVNHGIPGNKILDYQVIVNQAGTNGVPPNYTVLAGFLYNIGSDSGAIYVANAAGNSANILSKPFRVYITYEE
jgi:hypothetical protein